MKRGYILGRRGRFWEGHINTFVEKGGIFWEGGVDSGRVANIIWLKWEVYSGRER